VQPVKQSVQLSNNYSLQVICRPQNVEH